MIVHALEIDLVLGPQAADDFEPLIGLAAAGLGVEVERRPFRTERAADAERRQQAAVRQIVDRRALPRHQDGVAHREGKDIDAELDAPRAAGERRHHAHAFEKRLRADQAIGLPDRVDAARLAQIDPAPIGGGAGKRELHQPDPDRDVFRHHCLLV